MPAHTVKQKVVAYITWRNALLVFSHPDFPEAGIQAPAGTIEPGELPEAAVLREAYEETGLGGLRLVAPLGKHHYDMSSFGRDEVHHRYFFHLRCAETPPHSWRHLEEYALEGAEPIIFEFFWAALPAGVPPLIAGHDAFLPVLLQRMGLASS